MDSDQTPAMLASNIFHQILNQIQSSNLNFHLQLTPFSAKISLKKSLMRDKSGKYLLPFLPDYESKPNVKNEIEEKTSELKALADQNIKLERDIFALQKNHDDVVNECVNARETIEALKSQLIATKPSKIEVYETEINILKIKIMERDETVRELEKANMIAREGSNRLNKELRESKQKFYQEKASIEKQHKLQVKAWRKELGESNKEKIKLQKQMEEKNYEKETKSEPQNDVIPEPPVSHLLRAEVFCSICSEQIINYKPKYFLGEIFNPACENCDDSFEGDNSGPDSDGCHHSPVCVSRQPLPPPSPSVTFLHDDRSKYHEHMMSEYGAPGRYGGHERCMNGNSKNYGCDSCVWLKWFGDLHGFPDINPWDYKKYLESSELAALGLY